MSVLHHAEIQETLLDEVCEEFPNMSYDTQIEIAMQRFEDLCQ